jgi:hypothetical protein
LSSRNRDVESERRDIVAARGGVSAGAILTGVVVAFGSGFILAAVIAGILTAIGVNDTNVTRGDLVHGGIAAGIGLVIVQFLSYLWGGYTAGRMARGAGVINGLLVPVTALIIGVIVGAIAYGLGSEISLQSFNLPFNVTNLTHRGNVQQWGLILGLAALVAMFAGAILGGGLGARWHTKLERGAGNLEGARAEGSVGARKV